MDMICESVSQSMELRRLVHSEVITILSPHYKRNDGKEMILQPTHFDLIYIELNVYCIAIQLWKSRENPIKVGHISCVLRRSHSKLLQSLGMRSHTKKWKEFPLRNVFHELFIFAIYFHCDFFFFRFFFCVLLSLCRCVRA